MTGDAGDAAAGRLAACLGQLVALNRWVRASGGRLVVDKVGERAYEVFAVARLTEVLEVRRP